MEDAYFCIFGSGIDRSGYTVGQPATSDEMFTGPIIPDMDPMPILGHGDMGMGI